MSKGWISFLQKAKVIWATAPSAAQGVIRMTRSVAAEGVARQAYSLLYVYFQKVVVALAVLSSNEALTFLELENEATFAILNVVSELCTAVTRIGVDHELCVFPPFLWVFQLHSAIRTFYHK